MATAPTDIVVVGYLQRRVAPFNITTPKQLPKLLF